MNRDAPASPVLPPLSAAGAAPDSAEWLACIRRAIDEHAILAITDLRGVIVFANDRFCSVSGYAREELVGQTHRLLKSGRHPPEFYADLWGTIAAGRIWHGTICNRAKDGSFYWVESTLLPVPGPDGRPQHYLALRTDVTRLKKVEEQLARLTRELEARVAERTADLARSESLYRTLLASVTDYHYTVEVQAGRALATQHTPSCRAVTGYTAEEFAADSELWIKMVHPDDRAAVSAQASAALRGENPPPIEHRIVRKDGRLRWIRDTIVVRRDASGGVVFYDGIINDVTPEREAREEIHRLNQDLERRFATRTAELRAAHDQLRLFFEHAPIGISWVEWGQGDHADTYHLNERFCEIIGLSPDEASHYERIRAATHPEDVLKQEALMGRVRRGDLDSFTLEKRYVHPDGRIVWGNLTVAVLRGPDGRLTHQFAMLEDITSRRAVEEELRRSELRFRTYVECASEILYALTPAGLVSYVSPAWTGKLGHAVEKVVGRRFSDFVHPEDAPLWEAYLHEVVESGQAGRSVEYRMRHDDGRWIWHASTGVSYVDEAGRRSYLGIGRDVSVRRRAQEELRASLARREELERIIDRSPSVVVLWRADGEQWPVEFVSQSVRQFGFTPEEFQGRKLHFLDITHPDDRERVVAEVHAHAAAGHREYNQEYRLVCADGTVRWVDDHTVVRQGADGRVTHHEGIITDITSRKGAEDRERQTRERDLRIAGEVQQHLIPRVFPDISEVEVDALSAPSMLIGGDYYDVVPVGPKHWGFVVADVAGKGAGAALMMAACRATLRLCAAGELSPAAVVRRVNTALHPDMPHGMFIALFYGILDVETHALRYCRCGHEPALVIRRGAAAAELLDAGGLALGFDGGPLFDEMLEERTVVLQSGDTVALYTDGITEACNGSGEEFGRDRLAALLLRHAERPLAELTRVTDRFVRQFAALTPRHDDRTLLLLRPR